MHIFDEMERAWKHETVCIMIFFDQGPIQKSSPTSYDTNSLPFRLPGWDILAVKILAVEILAVDWMALHLFVR